MTCSSGISAAWARPEGKDCPRAGREYVTTPTTAADTAAFVQACLTEAGVAPDDLARYSTHQAAEDLEFDPGPPGPRALRPVRRELRHRARPAVRGEPPDRLTALILDGAVDRTRSANQFWADAARGFERALDDTFASCGADPACRADLPDPAEEYDRALRAFDDPVQVSYADPDGTVRPHAVDAAAIDSAISQLLYEPTGRSLVLRAVAAAERGDEVPLARLSDLLGSGEGPGASEFAYYAITCADYRVSPTADPHDFQAVEDYARRNGISTLRTAGVFTSQYPCLSWPYQPATGDRPAPITSTPYPVFVLGAADDPITPVEGARAIADRLTDGYLVMSSGGPHVTFGRGDRAWTGRSSTTCSTAADRRPGRSRAAGMSSMATSS